MPVISDNLDKVIGKLSEALLAARDARTNYNHGCPYIPNLVHAAKYALEADVLIDEIEATARKESKRLSLSLDSENPGS